MVQSGESIALIGAAQSMSASLHARPLADQHHKIKQLEQNQCFICTP